MQECNLFLDKNAINENEMKDVLMYRKISYLRKC